MQDPRAAQIVERQDEGKAGAAQDQQLHEAGEIVDDDGAFEELLCAGRLSQDQPAGRDEDRDGQPSGTSLSSLLLNTPYISSSIAAPARKISGKIGAN